MSRGFVDIKLGSIFSFAFAVGNAVKVLKLVLFWFCSLYKAIFFIGSNVVTKNMASNGSDESERKNDWLFVASEPEGTIVVGSN